MATINSNYDKLSAGYLFPEIARRTKEFLANNSDAKIMRLGIGDTTEALPNSVIESIKKRVEQLGNTNSYSGYGSSEGEAELRNAIANSYAKLGANIAAEDIFVSDGAKGDSANIQSVFGVDNIVAVQDPAYPVYVDSNVIAGRTGKATDGNYAGLVYMPCTAENNFFPTLPDSKVDIIYLCSPNNPTGAVANKEQLKTFVNYALKNKAVIIFDAAYAAFIKDDNLPKSIYEIEGAKKCAIEINSFSKTAGFTGVRLGWCVVPKDLEVENAEAGKIHGLWTRRQNTFFNGASNIVQSGGLAVFSEQGQKEVSELVNYYMENARLIKECLNAKGLKTYGGENAPYVWLQTSNNLTSWEFFDKLLNECHVVGTPGAGFGPSGEGYFRLSSFGHREDVICAIESINKNLNI